MKALGGKGNVVIIEGVKGSISGQDRNKGFQEVLKRYPNVKLLASQPANFQRLNALQVMENLLQTHRQIDGVLDRKSTRLNSSHVSESRMPSSA